MASVAKTGTGDATRIVNAEVHREPIDAVARDHDHAVTALHARDVQRASDCMRALPHTARRREDPLRRAQAFGEGVFSRSRSAPSRSVAKDACLPFGRRFLFRYKFFEKMFLCARIN